MIRSPRPITATSGSRSRSRSTATASSSTSRRRDGLEYEKPQLDERDPDGRRLIKDGEKMLTRATISLQSESHPIEFRKVEILPLGEK